METKAYEEGGETESVHLSQDLVAIADKNHAITIAVLNGVVGSSCTIFRRIFSILKFSEIDSHRVRLANDKKRVHHSPCEEITRDLLKSKSGRVISGFQHLKAMQTALFLRF